MFVSVNAEILLQAVQRPANSEFLKGRAWYNINKNV